MLTALLFPLASAHFDPPTPKEYNEVNPGLIAEFDRRYLVGAYRNSHRRLTVIAARRWDVAGGPFGVMAGPCTGYGPVVCSAFTFNWGPVSAIYVPRITDNAHVLGLMYRQALR